MWCKVTVSIASFSLFSLFFFRFMICFKKKFENKTFYFNEEP